MTNKEKLNIFEEYIAFTDDQKLLMMPFAAGCPHQEQNNAGNFNYPFCDVFYVIDMFIFHKKLIYIKEFISCA